jgi:regulator of protease activity HflC (stomatin/prohibitin superfamily)
MTGLHKSPDVPPLSLPATEVAAAMERVLDAEREATAEVEARRAECTARVAAARLRARTILERAEALAQAIHARTDRVADERARALATPRVAPDDLALEFDAALARVADWLTDDADD